MNDVQVNGDFEVEEDAVADLMEETVRIAGVGSTVTVDGDVNSAVNGGLLFVQTGQTPSGCRRGQQHHARASSARATT